MCVLRGGAAVHGKGVTHGRKRGCVVRLVNSYNTLAVPRSRLFRSRRTTRGDQRRVGLGDTGMRGSFVSMGPSPFSG